MKKVRLVTYGPRPDLLATWLQTQGWIIHDVGLINTQKGFIIGEHVDPSDFLGDGINDGTRIMAIEVVEEPDQV